jgi:cytochrome c nitrite reductase small subunit
MNVRLLHTLLSLLAGLLAGIGLYTFVYAKGLSYFSADPAACTNCHVMREMYEGWQKGSHHAVAACVDCHLPRGLLPKLAAKVDNGWRHSKAFTLQNFADPIRITPRNAAILQDNCVRCHADMVERLVGGGRAVTCVKCHADVGHGFRP